MLGVTIQGLTDRGVKAIEQHIAEKKALSGLQRKQYTLLFKETLISENPYMLEILIRPKAVRLVMEFRDLKKRIEEALFKNGAAKNDFIIREYREDLE